MRKRKTTKATVRLICWSHSQVTLAPESGGPERFTETGLIPRGVGTHTEVSSLSLILFFSKILSLSHVLLPRGPRTVGAHPLDKRPQGNLWTATKTSIGARNSDRSLHSGNSLLELLHRHWEFLMHQIGGDQHSRNVYKQSWDRNVVVWDCGGALSESHLSLSKALSEESLEIN